MDASAVGAATSAYSYLSQQPARLQDNTAASKTSSSQQTAKPQQDDPTLKALKARDAAVRQHEQAHLATAGGLAQGGASFSYEKGSDGQLYAVGGEVSIDVSAASTPADTIAKAQQIRAAALAPADPSPQDRSVAAAAGQLEFAARAELAQQQQEKASQNQNDTTKQKSNPSAAQLYQQIAAQSDIPVSSLIATA